MIESAVVGWSGAGMMALAAEGSGGSFMDSLPDPMKLQLPVVAFVIVLLVLMFVLLKYALFRPLTQVMDDRGRGHPGRRRRQDAGRLADRGPPGGLRDEAEGTPRPGT